MSWGTPRSLAVIGVVLTLLFGNGVLGLFAVGDDKTASLAGRATWIVSFSGGERHTPVAMETTPVTTQTTTTVRTSRESFRPRSQPAPAASFRGRATHTPDDCIPDPRLRRTGRGVR